MHGQSKTFYKCVQSNHITPLSYVSS